MRSRLGDQPDLHWTSVEWLVPAHCLGSAVVTFTVYQVVSPMSSDRLADIQLLVLLDSKLASRVTRCQAIRSGRFAGRCSLGPLALGHYPNGVLIEL